MSSDSNNQVIIRKTEKKMAKCLFAMACVIYTSERLDKYQKIELKS